MPQLTIDDVQKQAQAESLLNTLNKKQRSIIILIREGLTQADIARKLGVSRSYVCQVLGQLKDNNLIQPVSTTPVTEGKRQYCQFFELSDALKKKVVSDPLAPITACRVHSIRRKFAIHAQNVPVSTDKRTGFSKSWQPHPGDYRYKFWYPGKAGEISVTVDVHPRTIVAYMDKGQKIIAENPAQAQEKGIQMVRDTFKHFIEVQERFGVRIDADEIGIQVGKTHFGFSFSKTMPHAAEQTTLKGWHIDASVASEVAPHLREIETENLADATRLDRGIIAIENINSVIVPEALQAFEKSFGGINDNISQVKAMIQGGITMEQQYAQMQNFMTKVLDEMQAVRKELADVKKENEELKKRGGSPHPG